MKTKTAIALSILLFLGGYAALMSGDLYQYLYSDENILALFVMVLGGLIGIAEAFRLFWRWERNFGSFKEHADLLVRTADRIKAWEEVGDQIEEIALLQSALPVVTKADAMILRRGLEAGCFSTRGEAAAWFIRFNPDAAVNPEALDLVFPEELT